MNPLMDFLTERTLFIQHENENSELDSVNVGCVQGSVLGPKLFALYTKALKEHLPDYCYITAYADDAYVVIEDKNIVDLQLKIETSLAQHENFLKEIGMVVNSSKTELIIFNRFDPINITLSNGIKSSDQIKALGITFAHNLKWDHHVNHTVQKTTHIVKSIKFLRRWIDQDSALKIVTSQYYGTCYYGAPIWLNDQLSSQSWKRLNSQHYRAIRAAIRDCKNKIPRTVLDVISKRARPRQWANYITASTVIKLHNTSNTRIAEQLRSAAYVNNRQPGRGTFVDNSKLKIGKQALQNRLQCFREIDFDWIGNTNDDNIRTNLKRLFINCNATV